MKVIDPKDSCAINRTVSAAELVRNFAQCRETAQLAPLFVSSHGRPTHVLLSVDQFDALSSTDILPSPDGNHQDDADRLSAAAELAECFDAAAIMFDKEFRILFATRSAHASTRQRQGSLNGKKLLTAIPEIAGTPIELYMTRTLVSGETCSADLPSVFRPGGWIHLQCAAVGDWAVATFRDITDEVATHRLADVKEALLSAIALHEDDVFYVRLSLRGTIDRADKSFCARLGISAQRLIGIALIDLVARDQRVAMREGIEATIRQGMSQKFETSLLTNLGQEIAVNIALVPLQSTYGCEGAVAVMCKSG